MLLVRQNRRLKADIEKQERARMPTIEPGTAAPDFVLHNLHGQEVKLSDYAGKRLIMIFFSPKCPGCPIDIPNWKRLLAFRGGGLEVLWIGQGCEKVELVEAGAVPIGADGELERYLRESS